MNKILSGALIVGSCLFSTGSEGQVTEDQVHLIDEGRRVFMEETFDGNGRSCGSCHIPTEAYSIFPSSIARLSKKERDIVFAASVPGFENIDLIEERALFNISGGPPPLCPGDSPNCFDDEDDHFGPIFRGSMAIQALDLTTAVDPEVVADADFIGTLLLPLECSEGVELELPQLGWAGDGSPGTPKILEDDDVCQTHHGAVDENADGSIRAFATGAIAQHFPQSLDRIPGVDFRRATDEELDALEAFQRWLGRRPLTVEENAVQATENASEFDILLLDFKDPRVALGRDHFASEDGATCNRCHENGGARGGGGGGNNNTITSVSMAEDDIGQAAVGFPLPHDEGTIVNAFGGGSTGTLLGAFNTQSIIESAQKKAWFHNHKTVEDFEEAIAHYGSEDFLVGDPVRNPRSRPIGGVKPEGGMEGLRFGGQVEGAPVFPAGDGIEHLGAFLRALNAFYDLRDCERLIGEAMDRIDLDLPADNPIEHCMFNLSDVTRVLNESKLPWLHFDVQRNAKQAQVKLKVAAKDAANARGKNNAARKKARVVADLRAINESIFAMRDAIATQVPMP